MKVFVAGATGVVGRRAVRLLVAAGHDVTGVARSPEKAQLLRTLGAEPVSVDLFDPAAVTAAVAGHDVVCNLATHIPDLRHASLPGAWNETIRLRTVASGHLVDAALATGAARFVQESIAFLYDDGGDRWIDEEADLADGAFSGSVGAAEAQARRFTAAGGVGIALRFGLFYGAGASHTVDQLRLARRGVAPSIGSGDAYQSMIHLDDAASAVVAALHAPAGTYNVVEDEPATRAEQADAIADALGIDAPRQLPALITRLGGAKAAPMARSQRVSNRGFRVATGWEPAYPDQWSGWAQVVGAAGAGRAARPASAAGRRILVTAALACLAATAAVEGVWAAIFPASFYRSFPGTGHWVEAFPPYNEHLVRDVGQLTLAMLVVTVGALVIRRRSVVRLVGLAWLVESLPHFLFHLLNREGLGTAQQAASLTGLAFSVVLAVVCIVAAPPDPPRRRVVPPARRATPVGAGHST
jgi:nucleoside-diphosphate-sugar epimerase